MKFSYHPLQVPISIITLMAIAIASTSGARALSLRPHSYLFDSPKGTSNPGQDFLNGHNNARASVGVPPVAWNGTVEAYAKAYAAHRAVDCELEHSDGPYGENIAEGYGELRASDAVNMWVGEREYYDHASNACAPGQECGHYTQVVWRATTSIGCARAACRNGWMFVTCNYYPPGNYIGERPY